MSTTNDLPPLGPEWKLQTEEEVRVFMSRPIGQPPFGELRFRDGEGWYLRELDANPAGGDQPCKP